MSTIKSPLILLPKSSEDILSATLKQCMNAAVKVGFSAVNIQFGDTNTIHIDNGNEALSVQVAFEKGLSIFSDLDEIKANDEKSTAIKVAYGFNFPDDFAHKFNLISVGIKNQLAEYDQLQGSLIPNVQLHSSNITWNLDTKIQHFAWFITALSLAFNIEDSAVIANAAIRQNKQNINEKNVGDLWTIKSAYFPKIQAPNASEPFILEQFPSQNISQLDLYPVVDCVNWIERLLMQGVKTIQLRIKYADDPNLESHIKQAIELGRQYNANIYINDYWALAIEHGAYGVHLGQEDLQKADLNAIQQAGLKLGLSTHGYFEILRAKSFQPSYIALGHIFPTTTKQMPSKPQGLVKLKLYQQLIDQDYATVAIGGIDLSNAKQVWQTGINSLAVVRAITQADDLKMALEAFANIMGVDRDEEK